MRVVECEQGSSDWLTARTGKITGSRMCDVLKKLKTKPNEEAAPRETYKLQLVRERLSGQVARKYVSAAMEWGTLQEPFARAAYEVKFGVDAQQVGFVLHPELLEISGSSPDGLIGKHGSIEIKCPEGETHLKTIRSGQPPAEYYPQVQWVMACAERQWCDFVSFDPRLPYQFQMFVVRVERNDAFIRAMEEEVLKFNGEIVDVIAELTNKMQEDPLTITAADVPV